ncbi:DNA methyltransferase [Candidatus Accumulibacter sp. ACC003]|uniref:DNA methyltransferase n=1 Tax=Candidatus Accumulibacter sp. ACC003 TaxID=2823334 RepID=UPI0025BEA8E6|nr:DNA methyltransferase [Candidatus Accumulibacter sp. ACC003]
MTTSHSLFAEEPKPSGPVECLGQTFPNDEARRGHYLVILREKLKEPAFHEIEGFPIGTDEDILALSDPPYYTACPNPFIEDFIKHYGKPYDPSIPYNKEPFATDVSEGKNDPIYNAHSYHTKVPHKAIMRYILHYTQPGDVVFDGFCGTGMTGVAAQLCADRSVVQSLGYRVEADGTILASEKENGVDIWKPFSKIGARTAILNDLSPAATFIASNYNSPGDVYEFEKDAKSILFQVESEYGWMYETFHSDGTTVGRINYTVWSDVFICPYCAGEVVFWSAAVDKVAGQVRDEFACPHCSSEVTKRNLDRAWVTKFDIEINTTVRQAKQVPVLINYNVGKKRFEKTPDTFDLNVIERIESRKIGLELPTDLIPAGDKTGEPLRIGLSHVHHLYTRRNLTAFAAMYQKSRLPLTRLALLGGYTVGLKTARFLPLRWIQKDTGPMKPHTAGTLYLPSVSGEQNWLNILESRLAATKRGIISCGSGCTFISTSSATDLYAEGAQVDYIFLDPPFGSNLMYSELNFLWEAWLKVYTNIQHEAIENKTQKKDIGNYRHLMTRCFQEAFRILKPGRWMTVEFSNTKSTVWNAIQTALQEAGFVVANVSALDKKQGSFNAVTNTTSVKQDLVISAYKPNGGMEERFAKEGGSEESAWDFVRTHLKYLPTVKLKNGQIEFVAERDPRIIFDRLVAWFVRHSFPVPLSSQEFQGGLSQRFAERDGMVFLPEQVSEYDKKRMQTTKAPQMEMFIADERSAIDWLSDFLKKKPSTYQEIHPEFIKQLGAGWKKHEAKPELSYLLESNFLCYDPKGKDAFEIPSQIHSYLSTNWQEFRNLAKSDPRLKAKATDRWYVPDPSKARDLEMIRDRALLKEFETYRSFTGRRLKTFRLEAMRTGFKHAWGNRDYATIIAVAQKVPEEALQEDEKLLLWYDQALTRMEDR